ncbi:MAG: nuclear transport factor 2 family protein [Gammaproteobacteria bacterium]
MTLDHQVRLLTDRAAIEELAARYAHAAARSDGEAIARLFVEDGSLTTHIPGAAPLVLRGRDALRAYLGAMAPHSALPMLHNFVIEIDGDCANATISLELRTVSAGRSLIGSARYDDTLRREDGGWLFVDRVATFHHLVPLAQGWA